MHGKLAALLLFIFLLCYTSHASSTGYKAKSKRFIFGWFSAFADMMASPMKPLVYLECVHCKCSNVCSGEAFGEKFLGVKANETTVCGKQVWASINCTDKHNGISASPTTVTGLNSTQAQTQQMTSCNKLCSISAVAKSQSLTSDEASMCSSGARNSNEALPMSCCSIHALNKWKKGVAVMPICQSIPHYIPVAAFVNDVYVPGSAGILSSCLTNGERGFKIIRQECGHAPEIVHVSKNQTANNNPDIYYVIN